MVSTRIASASLWEQEMYDHVVGHIATEGAILDEYQRLSEDPSGSPAFRYLGRSSSPTNVATTSCSMT
jgi:hypothetical protein